MTLPIPDDESLAFARAVEALRVGFEALEWTAFPEVTNATLVTPMKAMLRLRNGERRGGCGFSGADVPRDPMALHQILEGTARKCDMGPTEAAHAAFDARWVEWTPEYMRATWTR